MCEVSFLFSSTEFVFKLSYSVFHVNCNGFFCSTHIAFETATRALIYIWCYDDFEFRKRFFFLSYFLFCSNVMHKFLSLMHLKNQNSVLCLWKNTPSLQGWALPSDFRCVLIVVDKHSDGHKLNIFDGENRFFFRCRSRYSNSNLFNERVCIQDCYSLSLWGSYWRCFISRLIWIRMWHMNEICAIFHSQLVKTIARVAEFHTHQFIIIFTSIWFVVIRFGISYELN